MLKSLRKHALTITLGVVLVGIMVVMCTPALANILQEVMIKVTPNLPGWVAPAPPEGPGSYGLELESSHGAWRLAAVLPYIYAAVAISLILGLASMGLSIPAIIMAAIGILVVASGIPIIWEAIP